MCHINYCIFADKKSCLTSKRMQFAEFSTIAKSLPQLRWNTHKSLILSYSEYWGRILDKKQEFSKKLSDHLVFCRNILIDRQLVVWRLSGNCLDGLLMRGIVRWMELHALAELRKWECIGQVSETKSAHPGQAACPWWESSFPQLGKQRARF